MYHIHPSRVKSLYAACSPLLLSHKERRFIPRLKLGGFHARLFVTSETLIRVDLAGNVVEGQLQRHKEFPIHSEIFRARPEITSVVHTHPIYSIAFAATGQPLRAISHEGAQFTPPDVPRFTQTTGLITSRELGEAVVATLGEASACYLVNHGIVVAGRSIEESIVTAINLERASQVQLLASTPGFPLHWTPDDEIAGKREHNFLQPHFRRVWEYYCRQIGPV